MIQAVIFDLDGLLVDTETICFQILKEILARFGHPFSLEEYTRDYSGKPETVNAAHLAQAYQLPAQGVALKPGAKELLAYLRETGRGVAMASSSTRERALNLLDQHRVTEYFQQFVFAGEVERGKPNPDVFLKACEKLGRAPGDCLVLEDSEAGIQAAHAAGTPVICVPDLKTPERRFLDMTAAVLPSLDKVIPYLSNQKG